MFSGRILSSSFVKVAVPHRNGPRIVVPSVASVQVKLVGLPLHLLRGDRSGGQLQHTYLALPLYSALCLSGRSEASSTAFGTVRVESQAVVFVIGRLTALVARRLEPCDFCAAQQLTDR